MEYLIVQNVLISLKKTGLEEIHTFIDVYWLTLPMVGYQLTNEFFLERGEHTWF